MRAALVIGIVEALALIALAVAQAERASSLGSGVEASSEPLISGLSLVEIVLVIVASPIIGAVIGAAHGRALAAAGVSVVFVSIAIVAAPLLQELMLPRAMVVFVPPGGSGPGGGFTTFAAIAGIVITGVIAGLEAALAAWLVRRSRVRS